MFLVVRGMTHSRPAAFLAGLVVLLTSPPAWAGGEFVDLAVAGARGAVSVATTSGLYRFDPETLRQTLRFTAD